MNEFNWIADEVPEIYRDKAVKVMNEYRKKTADIEQVPIIVNSTTTILVDKSRFHLRLYCTANGYDYYVGRAGKLYVYNACPEGENITQMGYSSISYLLEVKRLKNAYYPY